MHDGNLRGRRQISAPPGHLLVGLFHKPHGLKGEIAAELLSDVPERFEAGSKLYLSHVPAGRTSDEINTEDEPRRVEVETSRRHRGLWLLRIDQCETREDAENLRGGVLSIPASEAVVATGQFLPSQLAGLEVRASSGFRVGRVVNVLDYPAQDILDIDTGSSRRLIPFVADLIRDVDIGNGEITLDSSVDLESFFGLGDEEATAAEPRGNGAELST